MKLKPFIVMLGALCASGVAFADLNVEYTQSNKTANIFCFADKECNRPMFFRIWDTSNNYTLYKFENVGPIDKD